MPKKVIVVIYEYFYPGFNAGGPIQSLVNMIDALHNEFDFKVITTAFDLNASLPYPSVKLDKWNKISFTDKSYSIPVWYSSKTSLKLIDFKRIIHEANPSTIYINGLFTSWFTKPLILHKLRGFKNCKIIVAPRGMLQKGALQLKPFKKKIFLKTFKVVGLFDKIVWHSTTNDEANDIRSIIGKKTYTITAFNIPKPPLLKINNSIKVNDYLRIVYLSLITEKKNLLTLLQVLARCKAQIELSIYGPVKDKNYWHSCLEEIEKMPSNIKVLYKNSVEPSLVQTTIQQYDAFVSLTKGENFGHAIFEAFSCGVPVITSYFTPWNNLEQQQAGWNVDINNTNSMVKFFDQLAIVDKKEWKIFNNGAITVANNYFYKESNFIQSYKKLFS